MNLLKERIALSSKENSFEIHFEETHKTAGNEAYGDVCFMTLVKIHTK